MFARHSLVWLSAQGWQSCRNSSRDSVAPSSHAALERWQQADWPAIVRRVDADVDADTAEHQVCLGIALPPDPLTGHKARIALRAPQAEVRQIRGPLAIDAVIAAAPAHWRDALQVLATQVARHDLAFGVYGSVALQALTGASYVSASSDIDLLFSPQTQPQLEAGVALLQRYAKTLPLDGEIVFPSGQAVAWKEWAQANENRPRLLVKSNRGVQLTTMAALLASFVTPEHTACMH
ncbi:MAG: malonate decarboxylase holo-[acyl-carrier-protein] synthase [Glaciimonas sp.]|nr:malonate decarboxylase holo-[acyl-carrier-protein] synthase [Glaciimonas sp.]